MACSNLPGLACLIFCCTQIASAFRIPLSQSRSFLASKLPSANSCSVYRPHILQTQRCTKTGLKMAIDFGLANDFLLAAANAASSASVETPKSLDAFNSPEIQSLLKELKSISANTPIPEIQASLIKFSNSAEVRHILQDTQGLQNKVHQLIRFEARTN
jgi:hypothetical protein